MKKTKNDPLEWHKMKQKFKRRKPEALVPTEPLSDEDIEDHITDHIELMQKAKVKIRKIPR